MTTADLKQLILQIHDEADLPHGDMLRVNHLRLEAFKKYSIGEEDLDKLIEELVIQGVVRHSESGFGGVALCSS